jgi:hypothetical protein
MAKFNVSIICSAVYTAEIEVPDDATFEEAIEIAQDELPNIPLGELEYIPYSDELDTDNCSFEEDVDEKEYDEDEIELTTEQKHIADLWDTFDAEMENRGYHILITDESVRNEEREDYGKPLSPLGSLAIKDDNFCCTIKLIVGNNLSGLSLVVYEGNGSNVINTNEVGRLTFSEYTTTSLLDGIDTVINIFGNFNKDNLIPQNWEKQNIHI